uniref:Uncharacterized protein n=1 Tax=Anopheles minimus TaxID=112268 RepID=A0A182WPT1_9DIPT
MRLGNIRAKYELLPLASSVHSKCDTHWQENCSSHILAISMMHMFSIS